MRNLFLLSTIALAATFGALNVGCQPAEAPPAAPTSPDGATSQVSFNVTGMA